MSDDTTYVIVPSTAVGGLEKRLTGLFVHLAAGGEDIHLVISRELLELLARTDEYAALGGLGKQIVTFVGGNDPFNALRRSLSDLSGDTRRAVFHYGLASPLRLHSSRSRRTLYTIPNATLGQYNARGRLEVYGGIMRATRVDVLDPEVFRSLVRSFPWRRGSFSLTPGSYVDLELYRARPAAERQNLIVFAGLFSEEKQAPRLVSCVPELLSRLERAGMGDTRIRLLGRDPTGSDITARVSALGDGRVTAGFDPNPQDTLSAAKVFLSLQRTTNHPSKALLEAMATGCAPVVTDTRDSRRSAPDDVATYVPRDFTAADLATACIPILREAPAQFDGRITKMRRFLAARFSMAAMAAYYRSLYEQLRALPDR